MHEPSPFDVLSTLAFSTGIENHKLAVQKIYIELCRPTYKEIYTQLFTSPNKLKRANSKNYTKHENSEEVLTKSSNKFHKKAVKKKCPKFGEERMEHLKGSGRGACCGQESGATSRRTGQPAWNQWIRERFGGEWMNWPIVQSISQRCAKKQKLESVKNL